MNRPVDPQRLGELGQLASKIQGWLHPQAAGHLYELCLHHAPTGVAVELGSWRGLSTAFMAAGLRDAGRGTLYAVDTWQGTDNEPLHAQLLEGYAHDQLYNEFLGNMKHCAVDAQVVPLRTTTREAALAWTHGRCISVLHIDAGHDYTQVREDFELWSPLVVDGGLIVFDDVPTWEGPSRVVSELPAWYRAVGAVTNKITFRKLPA